MHEDFYIEKLVGLLHGLLDGQREKVEAAADFVAGTVRSVFRNLNAAAPVW